MTRRRVSIVIVMKKKNWSCIDFRLGKVYSVNSSSGCVSQLSADFLSEEIRRLDLSLIR